MVKNRGYLPQTYKKAKFNSFFEKKPYWKTYNNDDEEDVGIGNNCSSCNEFDKNLSDCTILFFILAYSHYVS